ncbi:hypothetical protein F4678DRAFT_462184 [Xylaria arbuscula]|nr:hypothetical protein F4678DRAFT_462184 [Xylaria arbuscula]
MVGNSRHKKLIVCCDGTANSAFKKGNYTNVLRFARCIKARHSKGHPQIVEYMPGIGMASGNLFNAYLQGTGIGIDEKIKQAYSFICNNYETYKNPEERDEIFLIGFSRGAFVARCVADLIHKKGVLTKLGAHYLPFIYESWEKDGRQSRNETTPSPDNAAGTSPHARTAETPVPSSILDSYGRADKVKTLEEFEKYQPYFLKEELFVHQDVRVKVYAVWDTVASIGLISTHLGIFKHFKLPKLSFVNSDLCPGIDHAIQALSLHEHRRPFCPVVWKIPNGSEDIVNEKSRLQQCWFMGYHSDIGGGIRSEGLSHYPLAWMMSKLAGFLAFEKSNFWNARPIEAKWKIDKSKATSSSPLTVKLHIRDSMSKRYRLAGSQYRKPNWHFYLPEPKTYPPTENNNEALHFTVHLLDKKDAVERPKIMEAAEFENNTWNLRVLLPNSVSSRIQNVWRRAGTTEICYPMEEDTINLAERSLLMLWTQSELDIFLKEHGAETSNTNENTDDEGVDTGVGDEIGGDHRRNALEHGIHSFLTHLLAHLKAQELRESLI